MDNEHIQVDGFNFNIASVKAMGGTAFVEQMAPQRPYGMDDKDWQKWLRNAYTLVTGEKFAAKKPDAEATDKK